MLFAFARCALHVHIICNQFMHVSFESIQSIFEAIFNLPCALACEIIPDKSPERFTPKSLVNRWIDRISVTVLNRLHTPQRHGWFIGVWMGVWREVSPTGILLAYKARIIPILLARTSWIGKWADWDPWSARLEKTWSHLGGPSLRVTQPEMIA